MPWKKGNRLRIVSEQEAPPEIHSLYKEIKEDLGIPLVSLLFQVYASYPGFLALHWSKFRPIVASGEFTRLAERLRADAYTRAHNYFEIANLCPELDSYHFTEGAKQELTNVIDLFVYADPVLLLISAAQQQAFDGAVGTGKPPQLTAEHAQFEERPVLVEEDSGEPDPKRVFEDVKQTLGMPVVTQDLRALARWPDFLRIYWDFLHPLLQSPLYQESQYGIHESAWTMARELPGTTETSLDEMTTAGMSEDDIASVVRLTQAFTRGLSSSLLNISVAKIGIEGGNKVESIAKQEHAGIEQESTPNRAA